MDERLKRRLVGATVLASLIVIFVPMLFEDGAPPRVPEIHGSNVPPVPPPIESFASQQVVPIRAPQPAAAPPGDPQPAAATDVGDAKPVALAAPPSLETKAPVAAAERPVPAAEPPKPAVGLSAWVIQVGAFANKDNAAAIVSQLKSEKYPAFLEETKVKGQVLYRVRVGPEVDRRNADQAAERLAKKFKLSTDVVQYP